MLKTIVVALTLAVLAPPARAEVVTSAASGFIVKQVMSVPVTPDVAYRKFLDVGRWWTPEHTFSGDAKNLSISPRLDGCFCEKLPDHGFVRHMTVTYVAPGKALRFSGGLGPLGAMAVAGAMQVNFDADGSSTTVTMTYTVGGYAPNGMGELAPIVDGVLGQQMLRYRAYAGLRK